MGLFIFLIIFLIFTIILTAVIISAFIGFFITRVPFVTTRRGDIELMVRKLNISSKDIFFDLGSGDGKVCFIVEELSGATVKGFELTWWTHVWAQIRKFFKRSNAQFINKNFFKQDWSEATIVYSYLYPVLTGHVEKKFQENCKPGTIAVLRDFPFPTMKPVEIIQIGPPQDSQLQYKDTKWNRFKSLLRAFKPGWPSRHSLYIYKL